MTTTSTDTELVLTQTAQANLTAALDRIHQVRAYYGDVEAQRLAGEFGTCLARLLGMGGRIMADGHDSLVASTNIGLVVGMVFHPEEPRTTLKRQWTERELAQVTDRQIASHPRSGSWSLHS